MLILLHELGICVSYGRIFPKVNAATLPESQQNRTSAGPSTGPLSVIPKPLFETGGRETSNKLPEIDIRQFHPKIKERASGLLSQPGPSSQRLPIPAPSVATSGASFNGTSVAQPRAGVQAPIYIRHSDLAPSAKIIPQRPKIVADTVIKERASGLVSQPGPSSQRAPVPTPSVATPGSPFNGTSAVTQLHGDVQGPPHKRFRVSDPIPAYRSPEIDTSNSSHQLHPNERFSALLSQAWISSQRAPIPAPSVARSGPTLNGTSVTQLPADVQGPPHKRIRISDPTPGQHKPHNPLIERTESSSERLPKVRNPLDPQSWATFLHGPRTHL
jgi:hypothetical protein